MPFGEYLPFPSLFSFAGGLTKEVGEFRHGASRIAAGCRRPAPRRVHLLRIHISRRSSPVRRSGRAGLRQHFQRRMVWRQRRLRAAPEPDAHARHRKQSLAAERDRHRRHGLHRSVGTSRGANSAQAARRPGRALRAYFRHHFLHPPRRLVRVCVCDNFYGSAAHALYILKNRKKADASS